MEVKIFKKFEDVVGWTIFLFKEECCEFDENHTNKYLMCGASNNQATKTKCMEVKNTSKGRKQREKERENTKEFLLPSSVQN